MASSSSSSSHPVVTPTTSTSREFDHKDYDDYDEYDDDYDDDDNELEHDVIPRREVRGLVAAAVGGGARKKNKNVDYDSHDEDEDSSTGGALAPIRFDPGNCILYTVVIIFVSGLVAIFLPSRYYQNQRFINHRVASNHSSSMVHFSCPSTIRQGDNYDETFEAEYVQVTKQITNNMTQFAQEFRETNFDDWDHTYEEVKNGMFHWKSTRFTPLQSGDSIYESACGIGLNLYMTLEILRDTRNITNLVVYGNEYLKVSADKANAVMDQIAPAQATKGVICPGDSSDLTFVPSNAFDLVYTGYLSPLLDPLHLNMSMTENFEVYSQVCEEARNKSAPYSEAQQVMVKHAQDEQNRWYEKWVREMIRIAKPGKAVIIEQVSPPYCDAMFDWGGVSKGWWKNRVLHRWPHLVEPDSLYMEDDVIYAARYHVYMRKKNATK